jgi:type II secretory pathway component PulF
MNLRWLLQRIWVWVFRPQRAEFYRDLADMFRRNEPMMGFFEGEIANATRTGQRARAVALRQMLARYQSGQHAGRVGYLMEGVMPRTDSMMLVAVDRAEDKVKALQSLANAVEAQGTMKSVVLAHAVFPLVMLPLCYVLIRVLSDVILSIDRSTPVYVKAELWVGMNGWARLVAVASDQFGPALVVLLVGAVSVAVWSLPRWKGRARLAVESWPLYGLYRDFQSGLLFTSMAMLLSNGATLKGALEDIAQRSSTWMRWHLTRVLRSLDDSPTGTIEAFSRGMLSPYMLSRAATLQRTASSFSEVLVELGTRENQRVLKGVQRAALMANVAVVGLLVVLSTFMGLATLTVPGRFSALMEPSTLMGLKQAHDAAQVRTNRPPASATQAP